MIKENNPKRYVTLDADSLDDAAFRARDRAWAALAGIFDELQEEDGLTYEELSQRVCKKKSQVHKWLASPCNVTLHSLGLLSEGMDSDLHIHLVRRSHTENNAYHQCESAALRNKFQNFVLDYESRNVRRDTAVIKPSSFDIFVDSTN